MIEVSGKKLVIAGGTGGMGAALARLAAAQGAEVVLLDRDAGKVKALAEEIGSGAIGFAADLSKAEAAEEAFARIGATDYVAAPIGGDPASGPVAEVEEAEARAAFDAKFWVQFHLARAAARHIRPSGSLLLWSGVVSQRPTAGSGVIAAINGAVEAFARVLAVEVAPVRVNIMSPGLVETPAYAAMPADTREAMFAEARERLPTRRIGQPEDIASLALTVLANPNVTGTVFHCDGGALIA